MPKSTLQELLKKLGVKHIDVAANGVEAVKMVKDIEYDVVFMDCQMPEMDGFEATSVIREQEEGKNKHLHIVALTADAMEGAREKCLKSGMDGYMYKPVSPEATTEALENFLDIQER